MPSSSTSFPPEGAQQVFPTGGTIPGSVGAQHQQQQLVISNGVLLAAVIFLFTVVVFVFLLYLYAKRYLGGASPILGAPPSSRFLFVDASPLAARGLPAAVLRALPVTVYSGKGGDAEALECAVCLSEVADGEKVRALPKCGHGFHVECIDMWFHSHDTCPLCRGPVVVGAAEAESLPRVPREEPALEFPTNVLFWGTLDDVTNATPPPHPPIATASASSSASGRRMENLVIDIPTRAVALTPSLSSSQTTPLPASRMAAAAADETRSPVSARLRSLRRLLSRGKQAVVGTSGDIEQGFAAAESPRLPKTPKTPPPSTN